MSILILLTRFPNAGSKVIETLTGSCYIHASIGPEEDMNTFYSFVCKGFIAEKITPATSVRTESPSPCRLYELSVSENTYTSIKSVLEHFVARKSDCATCGWLPHDKAAKDAEIPRLFSKAGNSIQSALFSGARRSKQAFRWMM